MKDRPPFISVTGPAISGFFAVMFTWSEEMDGYEPLQSSEFRFENKADAVKDAEAWAAAEDMEYIG